MKVNVSLLRKTEGGSNSYDFEENFLPVELENDIFKFQSPVAVHLKIHNAGKSLLVHGTVKTDIAATCCRCLNEFLYPLQFEFEDEWASAEQIEREAKDVDLIFERDEFEIKERIDEHIILHLPMKLLCKEDCKGLCPKCGVDLNQVNCGCKDEDIDPRLEILSRWNKGV